MNEEQHQTKLEQVKDHRFVLMIFGSIALALLLVAVALGLYGSSGAYQLDLSRPGDAALRSQVREDSSFKGFSSDGNLDAKAMKEFQTMYDEKLGDLTAEASFNGEVLSPRSLGIDQKSAAR